MPQDKLEEFKSSYESLVKAGENSLEAAYAFGRMVDDLHRYYSYADLGEQIGRKGGTIAIYRKLYRKYGHERLLLQVAEELGTYDVSKLSKDDADDTIAMRGVPHCTTCGSYNVRQERMPASKAQEIRAAVKAAQEGSVIQAAGT